MHVVRTSVRENTLSNPALVTRQHYIDFITTKGKGWVCEINEKITGFAVVDVAGNNIWALFVNPAWEGKGIGKKLHNTLLKWYFSQTKKTLWLGTSPNTRAETFYRKRGWVQKGMHGTAELKFEMTYNRWKTLQ